MGNVGPVSSLSARTAATLNDDDSLYVDDGAGADLRLTPAVLKQYLGSASLNAGELTANAPFTIAQEWNASAVAFNAIKVNITDTDSAVNNSNILDIQVDDEQRFVQHKSGAMALVHEGSEWPTYFDVNWHTKNVFLIHTTPEVTDYNHLSAFYIRMAATAAASNSKAMYLINATAWLDETGDGGYNLEDIAGAYIGAYANDISGDLEEVGNYFFSGTFASFSGTIEDCRAIMAQLYTPGSGNITNGYGFQVVKAGSGTSITNAYGIHISDWSAVGDTISRALHIEGGESFFGGEVIASKGVNFIELSSDPADPAEGQSVMWQSDGNGSGDDGDIMMKITAGGVTKTVTLVDFSAV